MKQTLILTKSSPPDIEFSEAIKHYGFEILHYPVLSILYHDDPFIFNFVPQTLIITSPHSLHNINDIPLAKEIAILCVGESTKDVLISHGFQNILTVFETGLDLLVEIGNNPDQYPDCLFLRGKDVQHDLMPVCKKYNIRFQEHIMYHSHTIMEFPSAIKKIKENQCITWSVFSSKGAQSLAQLIQDHHLEDTLIRTNLLCLSDRVLKSLNHFSWKNCYVCDSPTRQSFLQCLDIIKRMEITK